MHEATKRCEDQDEGKGKAGGSAGGGQNTWGSVWLGARNLDKTSGHCATVKRVYGP